MAATRPTSAFIAELVAGLDPFTAARYANVAAALSTTGYGAVEAIPSRTQVEAALAGHGISAGI